MSNIQIVHELDPLRWKTFVDQNPDGNIYHTPEMFEVFARAKGHQPVLWAAVQPDGEILALLPVVNLTLIDGPLRRLTTRAVAYGSVLCKAGERGQAALGELLKAYNGVAGQDVLFTEFRNVSDMGEFQPVLEGQGFAREDHLNFIVDLTLPLEVIWKNISKSGQQRIRTSRNKGTQVQEVSHPEQLDVAYRMLQDVYRRVEVPLVDKSLFQAALDVLAPRGMLQPLLARAGDQYAATALLLTYHGRIIYWYVAADRSFASYGPSELLVWHALEWGQEHHMQLFDFGGGGKPDQKYGPRDFKAKFGGAQVNYGRHMCIHAPRRLRLSEVGYQVYRRVSAQRHTGRPSPLLTRAA